MESLSRRCGTTEEGRLTKPWMNMLEAMRWITMNMMTKHIKIVGRRGGDLGIE
jgi:hypothetical protein